MAALTLHHFEGRALRSLRIAGEPWFVAADAADWLEHRDAANLSRSLDPDEKGTHRVSTPGGDQEMAVISEPGLYKAILQRRATRVISAEVKERIARFQRWVFHDVLPSIRRDGTYTLPGLQLTPAREEAVSVRRGLVSEARQTFGVRAAGKLWFALGLPIVPEMLEGAPQGAFDFGDGARPEPPS